MGGANIHFFQCGGVVAWWALVLMLVVHSALPTAAFVVPIVPWLQTTTTMTRAKKESPSSSSALGYRNLPSVEDVSSDEFSEQVYHGSNIVRELAASLLFRDRGSDNAGGSEKPLLFKSASSLPTAPPSTTTSTPQPLPTTSPATSEESTESIATARDQLEQLLTAQLSHQDGIRGFFAAYLTGEGDDTTADKEQVPALLRDAMKQSNFEYLTYSLCMNLIVSTAMISVHNQEHTRSSPPSSSSSSTSAIGSPMAQNSAIVAQRTKRIMASLKGSINMVRNCDAIIEAASNSNAVSPTDKDEIDGTTQQNSKLVHFWEGVFDLCAYTAEQKQDIANAFR